MSKISQPTKADLAITFIRSQPNRRATNDQLREALGLQHFETPSTWLIRAVKAGTLARDGKLWMLGDDLAGQLASSPSQATAEVKVPVFSALGATPPAPAATAPTEAPAPAPTPEAARFRVGDWSDGTIELQRDGVLLASLSADEFEQIGKFWNLRAA